MISPDTVQAVKERTDIVALIGQNVSLKRRGRTFVGLCPFHRDSKPSFHVNPERGFFHCFGCQESGSAIDYVMKLEGLTFPEAVRALADRCGVVIEESASDEEQRAMRQRQRQRQLLYETNERAAAFFERQLQEHPLAHYGRREIERRGLPCDGSDETVAEALRSFRLGYAPYGWEGLATAIRDGGGNLRAAETLGLIAARRSGRGHYDRFRHRLVFAVVDLAGKIVAFSGRALAEPAPDELRQARIESMASDRAEEPAKYINSPESAIYAKGKTVFGLYQARHAIRSRDQAVIVEGNFDVLSFHARGLDTAVAPLGTALTAPQAKLIKRYASTAVVLFDGDAAGAKAVRAARAPLAEGGLIAKVAVLPSGSDPDDHARQEGIEAVERLIEHAAGMLDHLIDDALRAESFRGGSLKEKHLRIQAVAELLASEKDPTLRAMAKSYADRLSSQLVMGSRAPADLRDLERLIRRSVEGGEEEVRADPDDRLGPEARSRPRLQGIGLAIFGAVLDFPELLDDDEVAQALTQLDGDAALGVAAVRRMWDPKKSLQATDLLDLLPPAIHAFASSRLASPMFDQAAGARTELLENAKKLRRWAWSRDKARLVDEISRAEGVGDHAAQDELLEELSRRSKRKLGLS
ncbi:MAG: DNA primase [Deltaproteobacteria bacterium]|nr:DNA primase [Deltaproteobacteria bacterium]MBW2535915.1 DNA primase [Deltaproteobacteria bacterium]